uniref:FAD dependent oxidoreductase domain-containing protein n=1 Tax=Acrobeloides nanus TaxID=290746 RepID=A0A914CE51_9BILA
MPLKIAIIGQGVSGVSCALAILERFPDVQVTLFGDRPFEKITSYGPPGHFEIDSKPNFKRWATVTFERFAQIYKEHSPEETGVKLVTNYSMSDTKEKLEEFEKHNADVVYNFKWLSERERTSIFAHPKKYVIHYTAYNSEGRKYVPWMKNQCESKGAKFVTRKISSVKELGDEFDLVINCGGLNGGKLAGDDDSVFPVRGVGFEVDAIWHKHMIDFDESTTYTIPKGNTVFLGTVRQPHRYDTEVTEEDRRDILGRYYENHPIFKSAKIISEWCGLRPDRPTVRVEHKQEVSNNGKRFHLIHDYGHGGNGFVLHWGCAQEVANFVEKIRKEKSKI